MTMTFDDMEQKLAFIGKAAGAVLRRASLAGAKVLAVRMQNAAPVAKEGRKVNGREVAPGGMRRSIGFRGTRARVNMGSAKAGLNVGKQGLDFTKKGVKTNVARHGHLYVVGTDHRYRGFVRARGYPNTKYAVKRTKNRIRYTGRAPAHLPSFIKTSAESAKPDVLTTVTASIQDGIEKAIHMQGLEG